MMAAALASMTIEDVVAADCTEWNGKSRKTAPHRFPKGLTLSDLLRGVPYDSVSFRGCIPDDERT
jgi:hypothetical protein